jgi:hypothetical protein
MQNRRTIIALIISLFFSPCLMQGSVSWVYAANFTEALRTEERWFSSDNDIMLRYATAAFDLGGWL